ncbi:hypothetical protein BJ165DRAFT_1356135, partial [Panaeolus papilionaceus]
YSILPALTTDGIIALEIVEGSITKDCFLTFLQEQIAPQLNPYPGKHSVVLLDNCAIHHDADIRELIVDQCGEQYTISTIVFTYLIHLIVFRRLSCLSPAILT